MTEALEKEAIYVEALPLLPSQLRVLAFSDCQPGIAPPHVWVALRLKGALDTTKIERAVEHLVQRHDALRICLAPPVQNTLQLFRAADSKLEIDDLTGLPNQARENSARRRVLAESTQPFDRQRGFFRARLLRLSAQDHVLIMTLHQVIGDRWSIHLLIVDLARAYLLLQCNYAEEIAAESWQRYVRERHLLGTDENVNRNGQRWRQEFADLSRSFTPPTDFPAKTDGTPLSGVSPIFIPAEIAQRIYARALEFRTELTAILLAALGATLAKWCNTDEALILVPQRLEKMRQLVGAVEDMLPLRVRVSSRASFAELLTSTISVLDNGRSSQPYSAMAELDSQLSPRSPVSSYVVLRVEPTTDSISPLIDGLAIEHFATSGLVTDEAICFVLQQSAIGLSGAAVYATRQYSSTIVAQVIACFSRLVQLAVDDPSLRVSDLQRSAWQLAPQPADDISPRTSAGGSAAGLPIRELSQSKLEREVSIVWARALSLPAVGLDEHFFDLGGHSLMIPKLQLEIEMMTGLSFEIGMILQFPTPRLFAAYCVERLQTRLGDANRQFRAARWERRRFDSGHGPALKSNSEDV